MQGVFDSREVNALEEELRLYQVFTSALSLMLADDRGKVRINKQTLNDVEKMANLKYEQNAAGAYILTVIMQDPPKPPKKKKPAKK